MTEIYPLTIVADRYTGVYSGGEYLAFNLESFELPEEISADDVTCNEFWLNADKSKIGFGFTVEQAFTDLTIKLNKIE